MTTFNEGVLEGLKIARVLVQKELKETPESKKLIRILLELLTCIDREQECIGQQKSREEMEEIYRKLTLNR